MHNCTNLILFFYSRTSSARSSAALVFILCPADNVGCILKDSFASAYTKYAFGSGGADSQLIVAFSRAALMNPRQRCVLGLMTLVLSLLRGSIIGRLCDGTLDRY